VARRHRLGPATGLGLLFAGAGTAAMVAFWAWFASPRLGRAAVAALLVGLLESFGILLLPQFAVVFIYALMAGVMIVRPWGLFGVPGRS